MEFKEFLKKTQEEEGYNPMLFEDELEKQQIAQSQVAQQKQQQAAAAGEGSGLSGLIARYFQKANGDAIVAMDGLASDLRQGLSDYLQNKWVTDEYFKGADDKQVLFKDKMHTLLDTRSLPRLQDFLHALGQNCQTTKINAK